MAPRNSRPGTQRHDNRWVETKNAFSFSNIKQRPLHLHADWVNGVNTPKGVSRPGATLRRTQVRYTWDVTLSAHLGGGLPRAEDQLQSVKVQCIQAGRGRHHPSSAKCDTSIASPRDEHRGAYTVS